MSEDPRRERALNQIVTLKRIAEDERAHEGERQAARDTMAKLRAKYDIPETIIPPPLKDPPTYEWFNNKHRQWFEDMVRDADKKQREDQARRKAAQEQRARDLRVQREKAQREWEARHANTDAMGVPLTPEDMEEARRDPLGWAAKQDKRTHNQKQQDMNHSWGQRTRILSCMPFATYFDQGGEPRRRNGTSVRCVKCGIWWNAGQAGWDAEAGGFVCTERVPGPRKKKSEQE